jgi:hypothetical protein
LKLGSLVLRLVRHRRLARKISNIYVSINFVVFQSVMRDSVHPPEGPSIGMLGNHINFVFVHNIEGVVKVNAVVSIVDRNRLLIFGGRRGHVYICYHFALHFFVFVLDNVVSE